MPEKVLEANNVMFVDDTSMVVSANNVEELQEKVDTVLNKVSKRCKL